MEELKAGIDLAKENKAPGLNGLQAECIKALASFDSGLALIKECVFHFWDGDADDPICEAWIRGRLHFKASLIALPASASNVLSTRFSSVSVLFDFQSLAATIRAPRSNASLRRIP